MTNVGSGQDDEEGDSEANVEHTLLNRTKIIRDAAEAIEVVSVLLRQSQTQWIGSAT